VSLAEVPAVAGVAHRHVSVNGVRLHVAEAGHGPPLILLHGWPQHWWCWRHLIPRLARDYRVLAPDLRGWGWSDAPRDDYAKATFAADILALMDAEELGRVRLIGHDWGGWVGFLLCMRHPERFSQYLALNIAPPWPTVDPRVLLELWRFWYQVVVAAPRLGTWVLRNRPDLVEKVIKLNARDGSAWTSAEMNAFTEPLEDRERARASSLYYRTFLLRELAPLIRGRYRSHRLTTPTRLLFGIHDRAISTRLLAGFEPYADDMEVELVAQAGHWIAEEAPDLVADRALAFFAAVSAAADSAEPRAGHRAGGGAGRDTPQRAAAGPAR